MGWSEWSSVPIGHFFLIGIGWPSILLYFLIIFLILRHRHSVAHFNSIFYHMLLFQAIPEILLFFHIELIMRPRKFYLFHLVSLHTKFLYFFRALLRNNILIGFIPFALNRFTAFQFPSLYSSIWSWRILCVVVALDWSIPALVSGLLFLVPSIPETLKWNDKLQSFLMSTPADFYAKDGWMGTAFTATSFFVCSLIYSLTFFACRRHLRQREITRQKEASEIMLLVCSLLSFSAALIFDLAINILMFISEATHDNDLNSMGVDLWYYNTEIMCFAQPWIIMGTNRHVRKKVVGVLLCCLPMAWKGGWESATTRVVHNSISRSVNDNSHRSQKSTL